MRHVSSAFSYHAATVPDTVYYLYMGGDESSSGKARQPAKIHKATWPLAKSFFYGGVSVVIGVVGYYAWKWITDSGEDEADEETKEAFQQFKGKHGVVSDVDNRLKKYAKRDAVKGLERKIEFHFFRNQQVSDVTALRGLQIVQKQLCTIFDIEPLTDVLRNNPSSLTPAEKHQNFNKVKTLCFCRLTSALYVLLIRLWLHRIEINILGRQWIPQLLEPSGENQLSKEDIELLQNEIDAYRNTDSKSTQAEADVVNSNCDTNFGVTHLFELKRKDVYHQNQNVNLSAQNHSTSEQSEANYVFLTSTRWLEYEPGNLFVPSLIQPIVEQVLAGVFPQHYILLSDLQNLLESICSSVEAQLFANIVDGILPESIRADSSKSSGDSVGTAPAESKVSSEIEAAAEVDSDGQDIPDSSSHDELQSSNKTSALKTNKDSFIFDTVTLKDQDMKNFVGGCLAETRDILESPLFHASFVRARQTMLLQCLKLVTEKLPPAVQAGDAFPLCRVFGRLCGIADSLLAEVSDTRSSLEHKLEDGDNQFAILFGQLSCVEDFCGAVYLPSIMCSNFKNNQA